MRKFNTEIHVQVQVDAIAAKVYNAMDSEFKHSEIVVEAIIGRALAADEAALGMIYNALNGFKREVNVDIGDLVNPKLTPYAYWTKESIETNNSVEGEVNSAEVIDIDVYRTRPVKIRYFIPHKDGSLREKNDWISLDRCELIASKNDAELNSFEQQSPE